MAEINIYVLIKASKGNVDGRDELVEMMMFGKVPPQLALIGGVCTFS